MLKTMTPRGLSAFVSDTGALDVCAMTAPTSPLSLHGTAVPAAARIRVAAVAFGADLPGPPRGAPV